MPGQDFTACRANVSRHAGLSFRVGTTTVLPSAPFGRQRFQILREACKLSRGLFMQIRTHRHKAARSTDVYPSGIGVQPPTPSLELDQPLFFSSVLVLTFLQCRAGMDASP